MNKSYIIIIVLFVFTACSGGAPAGNTGGPIQIELIALDHAPIRPAVQDVETLVAEYGDKVALQTYDFDTPEGKTFTEEHGLTDHTPIAIFINGQMEFDIDGRAVKFYSFPQGQGTGMVAEGGWTMDDLRAVLNQATN